MRPEDLRIERIETFNPLLLGIKDFSNYKTKRVIDPVLQITPPGYPRQTLPFQTGDTNYYNSQDLRIDEREDGQIPDGVYQIDFSIKPHDKFSISKYFVKTDLLFSKLAQLFVSKGLECPCSQIIHDDVLEVLTLIQAAQSASNHCDRDLADTLYCTALKKFKTMNDDCNC